LRQQPGRTLEQIAELTLASVAHLDATFASGHQIKPPDQRAVEAMLACVREPCAAQQLARGLGWTLPRTVDALEQLEANLGNTGQTLIHLGHRSYILGPRPGLLHRREIARCLRHTREPLDLAAAVVLHRALTCPREDRARDALRNPGAPRAEATFRAAPDPRHLRWTT
jgi:hypothetical protein